MRRYSNQPRYSKPKTYRQKFSRKRYAASSKPSIAKSLYTRYEAPRSLESSTTHSIRRMYDSAKIQSAAAVQDGIIYFALALLPDYTEFTNLYDSYRVDKIVVHFNVTNNSIPLSNTNTDIGTLLVATDFDGGALGLGLAQFESYESCQVVPTCKSKTVICAPRAELVSLDGSGTSVAASLAKPGTWYDCSNVDVRHYGVRWMCTAESAAGTDHQRWITWVEAFVTFKATR